MSDLLVILSQVPLVEPDIAAVLGITHYGGRSQLESVRGDHWLLATAYRDGAPLAGARSVDDERWAAVFAGDLIGHDAIPFRQILSSLETGSWDFLASLDGVFAVAAFDKTNQRLFILSDRRSQKPLFYRQSASELCVATNLAAICRRPERVEFDKAWLWQSLYFNLVVDDTTFLRDVKRLPPATMMVVDGRSGEMATRSYAPAFQRRSPLHNGRDALRLAADVFARRVPPYFRGAKQVACALTGGWDGRTMLALAPSETSLTAYTYGVPGCSDLAGAASTARAAGIKHLPILFDQDFVHELPWRAFETVYISGGLQGVLRSTLHYAYDLLTDGGRRFPLTISGIALDMEFRGHAQVPDLVSPDLARLFEGRGPELNAEAWSAVVGDDRADFDLCIRNALAELRRSFGRFDTPEHHLAYIVYPLSTHYFCGEMALSDHFTTVRVPAWDSEVIDLAFSIEQSTLSYSQFLPNHKRGSRNEMVLQAHLFRELAPHFYRLTVGGRWPAAVLAGAVPYKLEGLYQAGKRRLRRRFSATGASPLENWRPWLFDENIDLVNGLLRSPDTLVADHVAPSFIARVVDTRDTRFAGKLLTAEIILRLINSKWSRFW